MADAPEEVVQLGAEGVVDSEPLVARGGAEQRVVQSVDAPQLDERLGVVVDPEVDEDVREARVPSVALDDEEGRGLAPSAVAARRLRRVEGIDQPLCEPLPGGRLERFDQRVDRFAADTRMFPCAA